MTRDDLPPLNPDAPPKPRLAPPWVALASAWLGLIVLICAIVFPFLPGSRNPRAELEHRQEFSLADKFIPIPLYGSALALFLGITVLWQMRREPRPLPEALVAQRAQAWVGIVLGAVAAVIVYIILQMWLAMLLMTMIIAAITWFVAFRAPRS